MRVESCTKIQRIAVDAAQGVDGEGLFQFLVHVEATHVQRAVHAHGQMVPRAVAVVAAGVHLLTAGAEEQRAVLQADVEVLLPALLVPGLAVAHQRSVAVAGAEPQHQRVVLIVRAVELGGIQSYALRAVQSHADAVGHLPGGDQQLQVVAAHGLVVGVVAAALVHGVVVQQSQFVARQPLLGVGAQFGTGHGFVPEAHLQHLTFEVVAEDEIARAVVHALERTLSDGLLAVVEGHARLVLLLIHVEDVGHMVQVLEVHGLRAQHLYAVHIGLEPAVGLHTQVQVGVFVHRVGQHGHVLAVLARLQHQVEREVLARQVAFGEGDGRPLSVELQGGGQRDAALVRQSQHLEVVHIRQVVAGNLFREGNPDVVADAQDAVRRLWSAEGLRTARVLDARDDVRRTGQITVAVAAVADGAQVVPLLHGVFLAIEGGIDVAVVVHQFALTRNQGHPLPALLRVRVEGADVHPVLVALRREFVLQFDVVEVAEVDVVAVDVHGQVVAFVVERFGVHHPLVARRGDVHLAGRRHKVSREADRPRVLHILLVIERDAQAFVIIFVSGIHLHVLLIDDARFHPEVDARTRQRHAVNIYLGPLQVHSIFHVELHLVGDAVGELALVGHVDGEACGLAVGHVADARLLGPDAQFVDWQRGLVQNHTWIIENGASLLLPRTRRGTGQRAEHEVAVARRVGQSVQITQGLYASGQSVVDFREVLLHILIVHIQSAQFGQFGDAVGTDFTSTIDRHRETRLAGK